MQHLHLLYFSQETRRGDTREGVYGDSFQGKRRSFGRRKKKKKKGVPCPMVRKLPRDAQLDVPDMHRACKPEPGVCDNAEQKECLVIR